MKKLFAGVLLFSTLSMTTGCIGSFQLTSNLLEWNRGIQGKMASELVFFAFVVVPVYQTTLLIDGVILNSIEFWTNDNPVSMNEGEEVIQEVEKDGVAYTIKATKNRFHVTQTEGPAAGQALEMVYKPEHKAWYLSQPEGEDILLAKRFKKSGKEMFQLMKADGTALAFDAGTPKSEVQAALN